MSVLEPGGATTYDRVRDWALDVGGWGTTCPVPAEIMDALLLDCLQTIHTQIWDHDKYKAKTLGAALRLLLPAFSLRCLRC